MILLQQVLLDLKPHLSSSKKDQESSHYEIERQVQLVVDLSVAIARRILLTRNVPIPDSSRDIFVALGKRGIISSALSRKLSEAVGLCNLIVHEYGVIDYALLFDGLKGGFQAFSRFAKLVQKYSLR